MDFERKFLNWTWLRKWRIGELRRLFVYWSIWSRAIKNDVMMMSHKVDPVKMKLNFITRNCFRSTLILWNRIYELSWNHRRAANLLNNNKTNNKFFSIVTQIIASEWDLFRFKFYWKHDSDFLRTWRRTLAAYWISCFVSSRDWEGLGTVRYRVLWNVNHERENATFVTFQLGFLFHLAFIKGDKMSSNRRNSLAFQSVRFNDSN